MLENINYSDKTNIEVEPVSLEFQPAYQISPVLADHQLNYLSLNVRTEVETEDTKITPLNVCLIIDQSCSMRGNKLFSVKTAARYIVDQLSSSDYFSLISFNDRANSVVNCQRVNSRESIKSLIDAIEGRGGTEIAQGLYAGIQEMKFACGFTNLNYILLLTDGQTYGDSERCILLGEEAARHNITIYTMGIGSDWNEDLLDQVAAQSGGTSKYIVSPSQIVRVFMQQINLLRGTITPNSSLQFVPEGDVKLRQVHRVFPDITELEVTPFLYTGPNCTEVNLGPLGRGCEYTLLLELLIPPLPAGTHKIGELGLSYEAAGALSPHCMANLGIALNFTSSNRPLKINSEVRQQIEKVTAFKLQAKAWQDISDGNIEAGKRRLEKVSTHLLNMGEVELAAVVLNEVKNLEHNGLTSAEGRKKIKYGTRGLI